MVHEILVAAERARDFPQKPVYLLGTGESIETPIVSQMEDFTSSRAFRVAGAKACITHNNVGHLMIYDAFAHLPIYGLEDLGFVPRGEAGRFIVERNTAPGAKLPLNTNGGGLSYMHSGMYGHVRIAGERVPDAQHRPRPNPRRQDLGLPRRRRHVRRLQHHHHLKRAALSRDVQAEFALLAFPTYNIVIVSLDRASGDPLCWAYRSERQWPES
jgi:hypothetical protein